MKAVKILTTIILSVLFIFCISAEWRILLLMLIAAMWKEWLKGICIHLGKYGYRAVWGMLWLGLLMSLPRYIPLPADRVRHYYIGADGNIMLPPVSHWLLNVLVPEEEVCNMGMKAAPAVAPVFGVGKLLMANYEHDRRNGKVSRFLSPYDELAFSLEAPMSAAYVQAINQYCGGKEQSFYVIRPKRFDAGRRYPLVVFCHGYMGNWKLYTGIMKDLESCIVLCIGTGNTSGIFSSADVDAIHKSYIPLLEKSGYRVDRDNVSLIGLSNGGSAADWAYGLYASRFKNIVYVSTGANHSRPVTSKILIVGGGLDHCASSMRSGYLKIKRNGGKVSRYWVEDETHFVLVNKRKEIMEYLNRELGLSEL